MDTSSGAVSHTLEAQTWVLGVTGATVGRRLKKTAKDPPKWAYFIC